MTEQEQKCMDLTVLLVNEYHELPQLHPDDPLDFTNKVHEIQRMILCRTELAIIRPPSPLEKFRHKDLRGDNPPPHHSMD